MNDDSAPPQPDSAAQAWASRVREALDRTVDADQESLAPAVLQRIGTRSPLDLADLRRLAGLRLLTVAAAVLLLALGTMSLRQPEATGRPLDIADAPRDPLLAALAVADPFDEYSNRSSLLSALILGEDVE